MIELKGVEDFKASLAKYTQAVSNGIKDVVAATANSIADDAKSNTSGELADSINAEIADDGLSATITTNSEYAAYVEYGVQIPDIKTKNAKALHFEVDGKDVFAKSAKGHRVEPKPFMNSAFEGNRQDIIDNISNILSA
jgi:HK97 gp10 family phage protein